MFTYEFKMYHKSITDTVDVLINVDNEFYFTSINGNFLGSFIVDEDSPYGYSSQDIELQEYMEGISMHFRDETAKHELAEQLMSRYGKKLLSYQFTNDDVLEFVAYEDTDIEELGNTVRELIYDDVTFESKLSVVFSKENEDYTFDFDIN
ncbi:hypothetical protein [Pedobacter aquatilis]|uniref:hypothetical protein n=1 Tax=Pedobacter aquatilis TaxID=351343 RepID=UPI00292FA3ED|nr:hypothetical protein [Pedobacter aquatilis]